MATEGEYGPGEAPTIEIDKLLEAMNFVHAILSVPYTWDDKTANQIGDLFGSYGYRWPNSEWANEHEELPPDVLIGLLEGFRPILTTPHIVAQAVDHLELLLDSEHSSAEVYKAVSYVISLTRNGRFEDPYLERRFAGLCQRAFN